MKRMGMLLICGMLSGSGIGVVPVYAEETKNIEDEFIAPTVNAATGYYYATTSGIADTTDLAEEEELLGRIMETPIKISWASGNSSFEWLPGAEDIKEDTSGKKAFIRPDGLYKKYYIHLKDAQEKLNEVSESTNFVLMPVDEEGLEEKKEEWGWDGAVRVIYLVCPADTDSSDPENWQVSGNNFSAWDSSRASSAASNETPLPTIEELEDGLSTIEFKLIYPAEDERESRTITADYIEGTLLEIGKTSSRIDARLDLQPYIEQLKETENINMTVNERVFGKEDQEVALMYLYPRYDEEGNLTDSNPLSISVTEEDVLPDMPQTLGDYILVDEETGEEIAQGTIPVESSNLSYKLNNWKTPDYSTYEVEGLAVLNMESLEEAVEEQTGIEIDSDFTMDQYSFLYLPVEKEETDHWTPYLEKGDTIYLYTKQAVEPAPVVETQEMYRLYNPNSGEHFYTARAAERDHLVTLGWDDEGTGWIAPQTSEYPVYRVYNPNAGDHHYTMNKAEKDHLVSIGWDDEGIGWYSADDNETPLYRQYNPNAKAGAHNYTTNAAERDHLVSIGWDDEGIGWYGLNS